MTMKLCFATNNKHKVEEVSIAVGSLFEIVSLESVGITEELPETQDTLEGNAIQKAQFVFDKTGVPCFADDSGLEVSALSGAPGVYSARYAGEQKNSEDNMRLLLHNLREIDNRRATFRTVIALIGVGDTSLFVGEVQGKILKSRRGSGGFGYDPIFQPEGFDRTFAEMTVAEKNTLSHRAIAVQKLIQHLQKIARH